jgi:hypothetical protein
MHREMSGELEIFAATIRLWCLCLATNTSPNEPFPMDVISRKSFAMCDWLNAEMFEHNPGASSTEGTGHGTHNSVATVVFAINLRRFGASPTPTTSAA